MKIDWETAMSVAIGSFLASILAYFAIKLLSKWLDANFETNFEN